MADKPVSTLQVRLREAMDLRGMRPVDLVNASGVTKGSISLYLSGRNIATNDRLYAIAKALRVNPGWLMGYDVERDDISVFYPNLEPMPATRSVPILGIIAGEKTEAGRNRMIPLHTKIRPLMMKDWNVTSYRPFVAMFPGHTPHDCRRTFISRCVECGVDPVVSRKIVGHSGTDVHEKMYTFLNDPDFLCREIEKICY